VTSTEHAISQCSSAHLLRSPDDVKSTVVTRETMHRLGHVSAITACSVLAVFCGAAPTTPSGGATTVISAVPPPSAPVPGGGGVFTFSIDSACRTQFPPDVQSRSYPAMFRPFPGGPESGYAAGVLTLAGGVFRIDADGGAWNVVYRAATEGSSTYGFDEPPIWEWLSPDAFVVFSGRSEYSSTSPYGEWSFTGSVFYCASTTTSGVVSKCAVPEITCQSAHHRLRVTQVLPASK
jgi:hypothetical protein